MEDVKKILVGVLALSVVALVVWCIAYTGIGMVLCGILAVLVLCWVIGDLFLR